jgi:tRNA threonylcarbamoyl adenosine modification protein YeaZ
MNLLAIDTAADACSVGVVAGAGAPVLRTEVIGRGHAEKLMGMIAEAMGAAGLRYPDLQRIAVTVGPGSFTGLRIGIAAARGLALVNKVEVVGIGALAVHAASIAFASGRPVMAVLAAGRGECYGQIFAGDGAPLTEPAAASPQVFAAQLAEGMALAGSGADLVVAALPMTVRPAVLHRNTAPDIATLCRLGLTAPAPSGPPKPLYIRAPDAKPQAAKQVPRT